MSTETKKQGFLQDATAELENLALQFGVEGSDLETLGNLATKLLKESFKNKYMAEVNIYFNDLAENVQEELWRKVTKDLLDNGEVSQKGRHESEEEFQRRLEEETDHYINCNNFANRFII